MYKEDKICNPRTSGIVQKSAAIEICEFAAELEARAKMLAGKIVITLNPVITPLCSEPVRGEEKTYREYPPLFSELRSHFFSLVSSLNSIEDTISHTEL